METITISGRYKIISELGQGGFGQTYLAEDLHLPTKPKCVVKQLKPDFNDDTTLQIARRLFEQEAEVLYRLGNHQFIPQILAHFEENGEFYLVQEFIEGDTLAQEINSGKRYSEIETVELLGQILETLTFVHSQNVIHRDIKPSNIIHRFSDGRYYLIDFGAVKQVSTTVQKTTFQSTIAIGSQGYMPSEQISGKPRYSSDLYALGLVGVEALTGLHPLKLAQNQNSGEFAWQHKVKLHPEVEKYISKIIRYDFRQRYNSGAEAFAALKMVAVAAGLGRKRNAPLPPVIAPPKSPPMIVPIQHQEIVGGPLLPPTQASFQNTGSTYVAPTPTFAAPFRQNSQSFSQTRVNSKESKDIFGKIWKNDLALGLFVTVLVFGVFFISGYSLVSYAISNAKSSSEKNEITNPFPDDSTSITKIKYGGAFQEALTQANEAQFKEKKATTKFEWEEIANQWKRAYTLLAAIDQSSPDYAEAQKRLAEYQQNSETALQKSKELATNPVFTTNTSPSPKATTSAITSTYPTTQSSSYPNATPTPNQKVTMPGPRKDRMYIAYNLPGWYSNPSGKYVVTEADGDFTATIGSSGAYTGAVSIRINAGPDSCDLDLMAPRGGQLQRGTYDQAQRYPFQSPTRPGLDFDHHGSGCNELNGSFTINNILYSSDGKSVLLLDATFIQNCGNTIMGRIHYDGRY
jgi:serine/threonine protein kinase